MSADLLAIIRAPFGWVLPLVVVMGVLWAIWVCISIACGWAEDAFVKALDLEERATPPWTPLDRGVPHPKAPFRSEHRQTVVAFQARRAQ